MIAKTSLHHSSSHPSTKKSHIKHVKFEHLGVHEIGQNSHLDYHSTD